MLRAWRLIYVAAALYAVAESLFIYHIARALLPGLGG